MYIERRNIIKGVGLGAGAVVLSPFLNQLQAQEDGKINKLPKRFVFIVKDSGILPETITPPTILKQVKAKKGIVNVALKKHALEASMKALEPLKDYVSIVQGFSGRMCAWGHTAMYGGLGVYRSTGVAKRATVDHVLSQKFPSAIGHLASAYAGQWSNNITEGLIDAQISASGPQKPIAFQLSPDTVFQQLFGTVAGNTKDSKLRLKSKKDLLSFLSNDIKKLKKSLPTSEKTKLEHYVDALESLQGQDVKIAALKNTLIKHMPQVTDKYSSKIVSVRQEAHFEMIAAALITGMTNVATFQLDNSNTEYRGLGVPKSWHAIGHHEGVNGKTDLQCREIIRSHHFKLIAGLANKLKSMPEGDGNMLDNTMIVYMSNNGHKHHSQKEAWPMVIVGGCGGKLKIPGRYIEYPEYKTEGHKTIGNWWTTVLNAYGIPIEHYGDMDPTLSKLGIKQKGLLPELIG